MTNIQKFMHDVMTDKDLAEKFASFAIKEGYDVKADELIIDVKPISDESAGNAAGGRGFAGGMALPDYWFENKKPL